MMREPNAEAQSKQKGRKDFAFLLFSPHEWPHTHALAAQNLSVNRSSINIIDIETHHLGDHEPRRRAGRSGGGLVAAAAARICVDVHHVAAVGGGHVSLLRRWWLVFHLHLGVGLVWVVAFGCLVGNEKNDDFCSLGIPIQDAVLACGTRLSATHKLILNLVPLLFRF